MEIREIFKALDPYQIRDGVIIKIKDGDNIKTRVWNDMSDDEKVLYSIKNVDFAEFDSRLNKVVIYTKEAI